MPFLPDYLRPSEGVFITGAGLRGRLGFSVQSLGDFNGDGVADLAIGAPGFDHPKGAGEGTIFVLFGGDDLPATLSVNRLKSADGLRILAGTGERLGFGLGAVDLNGDGLDDLVYDTGFELHAAFGAATRWPGKVISGAAEATQGLGVYSALLPDILAGADVDGDGRADVVLADTNEIEAALGDPEREFETISIGAGSNRHAVVDLNGDGVADIVTGTYAGAGQVTVRFGGRKPGAPVVVTGTSDGDQIGVDLGSAGDFNGDGIDDLFIAGGTYSGAGFGYVVYGRRKGFGADLDLEAMTPDQGFKVVSSAGATSFVSIGPVGDLNGDGATDFAFGDNLAATVLGPFEGQTLHHAGAVHVLFGGSAPAGQIDVDAMSGAQGFSIRGGVEYGQLGLAVTGGQDLNADGLDDLVLGTETIYWVEPGQVQVIYGQASWGGANDDPIARPDTAILTSGQPVDLTGENGKGRDRDPDLNDLAVTRLGTESVPEVGEQIDLGRGLVANVTGPASFSFDAPDLALGQTMTRRVPYRLEDGQGGSDQSYLKLTLTKASLNLETAADLDLRGGYYSRHSNALAGLGDINGDGIADFATGSLNAGTAVGPDFGSGRVSVYFGTDGELPAFAYDGMFSELSGFSFLGGNGDVAGYDVAGGGDVNGDGLSDVILSARDKTVDGQDDTGEVYVIYGCRDGFAETYSADDIAGDVGMRIEAPAPGLKFGQSVAIAGDLNGDGIDDMVIAERGRDAYVVFGGSDLPDVLAADEAGFAVAGHFESIRAVGDINDDGIPDLGLGGFGNTETAVLFGRADDAYPAQVDHSRFDGGHGFRLTGLVNGQLNLGGIGDFNGDGVDDLLVGDGGVGDGARKQAYVVFGRAGGWGAEIDVTALNGRDGFKLTQAAVSDSLGFAVAGAGDFNGDGLGDLLVGANLADPAGREKAGAAYLIFGTTADMPKALNMADLDGIAGIALHGASANDRTGHTVAGLGDVNGDGLDDVMIGALTADGDNGRSYLLLGRQVVQRGGKGADALDGTHGPEALYGLKGRDTLEGAAGNDTLIGGGGRDRLLPGPGDDTLTGGAGADVFVLKAADQRVVITDFDPARDSLRLSGPLAKAEAEIRPEGSGSRIEIAEVTLILTGVTPQTLDSFDIF